MVALLMSVVRLGGHIWKDVEVPGCNYQSPFSPDGAVSTIATVQSVPRCSVGNTRSPASPLQKSLLPKFLIHTSNLFLGDFFFTNVWRTGMNSLWWKCKSCTAHRYSNTNSIHDLCSYSAEVAVFAKHSLLFFSFSSSNWGLGRFFDWTS